VAGIDDVGVEVPHALIELNPRSATATGRRALLPLRVRACDGVIGSRV
jgi:hypothetical protein